MNSPRTAVELAGNALALLAAGSPDAALDKVAAALAADPECRFAHFTRGSILKSLDRCEEALVAYDRAAMVEDAWWHAERTTCLSLLGRHKEAFAAANEAVRLAPWDSVVWYRKGAALIRAAHQKPYQPDRKLEKSGEAALKRAIELNPDAYTPRIDLARLYLAKDHKAAERLISEALVLKFGDPRIHMVAAELALRSGRLDEAESHADIVVTAEPGSSHAVSLLLRISRARRSRVYNLLQQLSAWLGRSRFLVILLAAALGLGAAMSGVTRTQAYSAVVLFGLALAAWIAFTERQVKRATAKATLSSDY